MVRKTSLDEFGEDGDEADATDAVEAVDAPRITKKRPINHPYKNHTIGNVVWIHNRGPDESRGMEAYYTPRREEDNLFKRYDSYPITDKVLQRLVRGGAERILVSEQETGNVYEYTIEQYLDAPEYEWEQENNQGEHVRTDVQKCPAREDALHTWASLGDDLFHSPV